MDRYSLSGNFVACRRAEACRLAAGHVTPCLPSRSSR